MRRKSVMLSGVLLWVLLCGCEQVEVRLDHEGAPPSSEVKLQRGVRFFFSNQGLEGLWEESVSSGVTLSQNAESFEFNGLGLRLGPVEQALPVSRLSAYPKQELTTMLVEMDAFQIIIPVRFEREQGTVICRWQLAVVDADIVADLAVIEDSTGYQLKPVSLPSTQFGSVRLDPVGSCPVDLTEGGGAGELTEEELEGYLTNYGRDAIGTSVRQLFSRSLLELVGVQRGFVELSQPHKLAVKQGSFLSHGDLSEPITSSLKLAPTGFTAEFDYAFEFEPAVCAPRVSLDALRQYQSEPPVVDPALLDEVNATLAISVSHGVIERVMQSMARGGFMCVGMERPGTASQTVSMSELGPGELGIEETLFGGRANYAMYPGALPSVEFVQESDTIKVSFESFLMDFYSDLFGTSALMLHLEFGVELALKFVADQPGAMALRLDSVHVSRAEVSSEWLSELPEDDVLRQWVQRALVLVLGERIVLPSPLEGEVQLNLVGSRIRSEDVLLFLSL